MSLAPPIDGVLSILADALTAGRNCVVVAEPGAGKTTRVPLALMDASWLAGSRGAPRKKIVMLEPRRIAARSAVAFMAALIGEAPGQRIGYRIRGEARVSDATVVEVVTEGILTRMLQNGPELDGVGLVIFDEFHERSIHADLGLALCLESQRLIRPDLRLMAMSATLETESLAAIMGDAAVIKCPGRSYPVEVRHLEERPLDRFEATVADGVRRALRGGETGDLLVFLPGRAEIFRVQERLEAALPPGTVVVPLFAEVSTELQDQALRPDRLGRRKIILATSIAETSLTIDGVRIVVDGGLARVPRFDVRRGMSTLETVPVSRAAADQRAGRAGRQAPGVCYRLWTAARHQELPPFFEPEIQQTDLAPLLLETAAWGEPDPFRLPFLTPPPVPAVKQASEALRCLGAIDEGGRITPVGREFSRLGVHPRLARMLLEGVRHGFGALACDVAALLEEHDIAGRDEVDCDLAHRWHTLDDFRRREAGARGGSGARLVRVARQAERLRGMLRCGAGAPSPAALGVLVAWAYPERLAKRRGEGGRRYLLRSGSGAELPERSRLNAHEFLAIAHLGGGGGDARIFIAEPISREDIDRFFAGEAERRAETVWDESTGSVRSREREMLGAIVLNERSAPPAPEAVTAALVGAIRARGLAALPWSDEARSVCERSEWMRRSGCAPAQWPDLSPEALLASLEEWLAPFLGGITSWEGLRRIDLTGAVTGRFDWSARRFLDEQAPSHIELPTGTRAPIDYSGEHPRLAVKLQEMFGQSETPRIAGGRVGLVVELLSPAKRPLQVTRDLASFWRNSYTEVRKEMQGRYPKHPWPVDPLAAAPTRRTKRREP